MEELFDQIVVGLTALTQEQATELNGLLNYDVVEVLDAGGDGADLQDLSSKLNSILYLEDQEVLYALIEDEIGDHVEISDKPNEKRVKRPNGGGQ